MREIMDQRLYVCWTIDWQDNYLWDSSAMRVVSRALHTLACNLVDGKVTWLAEVDDLTDITRHAGIDGLIKEIEGTGGEVGIHIHHTSVDRLIRREHYRRASARVIDAGGSAASYAAGMGNYIDEDTQLLVNLGITAQRSYVGNYVNAALPPLNWMPPGKRGHVDTLFPPATHKAIADPRQNPSACDWRGAEDKAGYTDPDDYRRVLARGQLFAVPLGILGGNEDGEHQLHIQPRISLERLQAIFASYHARSQHEATFVACYFHPYDLTEQGTAVTDRMERRWEQFVAYQRQLGVQFVTLNEARRIYEGG
jgi:hypothetical protein